MKTYRTKFFMLVLVALLALGAVTPAMAQDGDPEPEEPVVVETPVEDEPLPVADWVYDLLGFVPSVLTVAGVGGIVGFAIDVYKLTGRMKDDTATKISVVINFIIWTALWFGARLGQEEAVRGVIAQLGIALPALLTMFGLLGGAKAAHWFMKQIDELSFSLTARKEKEAAEKAGSNRFSTMAAG